MALKREGEVPYKSVNIGQRVSTTSRLQQLLFFHTDNCLIRQQPKHTEVGKRKNQAVWFDVVSMYVSHGLLAFPSSMQLVEEE